MKQKPSSRGKRSKSKSILRLPDPEHAKAAVLNGLNSADARNALVTDDTSAQPYQPWGLWTRPLGCWQRFGASAWSITQPAVRGLRFGPGIPSD
jgi:hypothetical protein